MGEWFVCVRGGRVVGPVSTALLLLGIRSGKVPDDALVCGKGEKTWRPLVEVAELLAALPGADAFRGPAADQRYEQRDLLGRGGMGEVHLFRDAWIGREVAMKVAHATQSAQAHLRARFVREALVQGQLEHPSVVPVYDLGTRPDGTLFFTMKRVRGLSLAEIIDGLRSGDAELQTTYGRRRLLSAMSQVCLAVSFAHSRGVVHRDLKPANVMLGDFGEVYVLDWGVAKVLEDAWAARTSAVAEVAPVGQTQAGALMGTPGFASPEQVRGDEDIGPASDVYSLGATLFELLALEPLHKGRTVEALTAGTLDPRRDRPSQRERGRDVPPELDDLVARATALDIRDRTPSARELHTAIERYLDGERDAERRRDLARAHSSRAAESFSSAARGGPEAEAHRERALRELGSALALDPTNSAAMQTLVDALLEAPDALPPEAEVELAEADLRDRSRAAKNGMLVYSLMGLTVPLFFAMPIRRPVLLTLLTVAALAVTGFMAWLWRSSRAEPWTLYFSVPLAFVLVGLMGTIFGPFVMVPGTAAVTVAGFLVGVRANRTTRRLLLGAGLISVFLPAALQLLGITPPSYIFEPGGIRIVSNLVDFQPVPALLLLAVSSATTIVATVLTVGRAVESLVAAERRNFARAFRLRQMLPRAATEATSVR